MTNKKGELGGAKKVNSTSSSMVNNPIIVNGKCSFCPFNGDILKETISCYVCSKSFHSACRDKRGNQLNSSICSTPFLESYSPISSHHGANKKRWGKFAFICEFCNTPDLHGAKQCDKIIDVVNVSKSPTKSTSNNVLDCNISSEAQTIISGDINGYDSECENDISNPLLLDNVKFLLNINHRILDEIKTLQAQSTSNSEKFDVQISEIKSCLDNTIVDPAKNFVNSENLTKNIIEQLNNMPASSTENPTQSTTQKCKPYSNLQNEFLAEPLLTDLNEFITNTQDFQTVKSKNANSNRDVLYFGEFKYRYGSVTHDAKEIPEVIQPIINKISESYPDLLPVNSCLVTRYKNGNNVCPPHSDNEPFIAPRSNIFTLSIGSQRSMEFTSTDGSLSETIELPSNSLLTFTRASQEAWKHAIPSSTSPSVRYSLTFRLLAPYYANTTLIVGDSNTEHINFGSGRNKLGVWLPGERVKAGKISHIPGPEDIKVPYRHMVIHSGINDLRAINHLPIPVIAKNLDEKCNALLNAFPKMKIHISSILPTKDLGLNAMANEFNHFINEISKHHQNISVISHNNMIDLTGKLDINLGRHNPDGTTVKHDTVHLGSKGIALLCMNIKKSIVKMKPSTESFHQNTNSSHQNITHEPRYPYWSPNSQYNPDLKASPPQHNPWTGDHSSNFSENGHQIFNVNNSLNGYQLY